MMPDFAKSLFSFGGFNKSSSSTTASPSSSNPSSANVSPGLPALKDKPISAVTQSNAAPTFRSSTSSAATALSLGVVNHGNIHSSAATVSEDQMVLSDDDTDGSRSGAATARPSRVETDTSHAGVLVSKDEVAAISTATATTTPPLDSVRPKGKLRVRIIEARNLLCRSEFSCPYVICTFDTSEFISHGPSADDDDSNTDTNNNNNNNKNNNNDNNNNSNNINNNNGNYNSNYHPTGIAIPSKSRQSSSLTLSKLNSTNTGNHQHNQHHHQHHHHSQHHGSAVNPMWKDEAQFDVTSDDSELDVSIYDAKNNDLFLGHARIRPDLTSKRVVEKWLTLEPRVKGERVSGEVRVSMFYEKVSKRQYGPDDFEVLRLVGKGTFGQVYQVRKKDTQRIYAMKVLSKKAIVQKKEVAHTIGERNILVRTSSAQSAFIVGLKMSFQTPTDLYLVTDYMSGGELFWHLQKEGRFSEQRAKFYIAELIVALEHLHDNDIVYRDLKPENILLDANGHIALCDFGLSKANLNDGGTTNTFCGTTEYLAPEVLLDDQGYTKMVDFWSLGVLVFEMCCGWSPFYAEDNQQMYKNIAFGKVRFPKDALSPDGRNFVKGLLNRNPKHRLGATDDARELRAHPFFSDIDWDLLIAKKSPPPFKPQVASETDTSNFDPEFTQASTSVLHRAFMPISSTPLSPGIQANFQGFTYVDDSSLDENFRNRLGTSYRPRSHIQHDDDIDLYDDKDIKISQSYYNESDLLARSNAAMGTSNKRLGGRGDGADNSVGDNSGIEGRSGIEDDDVDMMMDDDEHEFVNGQGFEM